MKVIFAAVDWNCVFERTNEVGRLDYYIIWDMRISVDPLICGIQVVYKTLFKTYFGVCKFMQFNLTKICKVEEEKWRENV